MPRSAAITTRSEPGTHTVSERRRSPVTIASATSSGPGRERLLRQPRRGPGPDEPRPHHHHLHPGPLERVAEPWAKASSPALLEP